MQSQNNYFHKEKAEFERYDEIKIKSKKNKRSKFIGILGIRNINASKRYRF